MTDAYWESQPPAPSDDTIRRALSVTGFDYTENLWWRNDPRGGISLNIRCNDLFYWGSSDLEPITDENIGSLEQTISECEDLLDGRYSAENGFLLWCARQRNMRPQGAYYEHLDERLHPLFTACGPIRDVGTGNPQQQPAESV